MNNEEEVYDLKQFANVLRNFDFKDTIKVNSDVNLLFSFYNKERYFPDYNLSVQMSRIILEFTKTFYFI